MDNAEARQEHRERVKSWLIIFGLGLAVTFWGFLIFFTVGDKGVPPWDYSILPDVPGQSVYSTHGAMEFSGAIPEDFVASQHVMGRPEEHGGTVGAGGGGR